MTDEQKSTSAKTQAYSAADDPNKTQAYTSKAESTKAYAAEEPLDSKKTGTYDKPSLAVTDKTKEHNLGIGDRLTLNQKEYEVIGIISGEGKTGEAVIYKIKDNKNNIFVLKLYFEFKNVFLEPNPEALSRIKEIDDPDILKLYDYGTGKNKYQQKFCFEIAAFAQGGDLLAVKNFKEKYTAQFIMDHVIPEIFRGIQCLHRHKIYHCDLKPQNVFYLDVEQTDLVIGDYGSAITFENKDLRRVSTVKGTDFYLPPEQGRGIVSVKNDYYSLGMILLHLLYPNELTYKNFSNIVERQYQRKLIIDYDPKFSQLNHVIEGLTLQDIEHRWGEKEVSRWLMGETVPVEYEKRSPNEPIKLGSLNIYTEQDLIKYIENEENWYQNLFEKPEDYQNLLQWLGRVQDKPRKDNFDKMVKHAQQFGDNAFVKEAVLRYFVPERPVLIEFKRYDFWHIPDLEREVEAFFEQLDDIFKNADLKIIRLSLFQFEFSLRQLEQHAPQRKIKVAAILEKIRDPLRLKSSEEEFELKPEIPAKLTFDLLIEIFYVFFPARDFRDKKNVSLHTLEQVGLYFAKNPEDYREAKLIAEKNVFLKKKDQENLINLDLDKFLWEALQSNIKSEIHFISLFFNRPSPRNVTLDYKIGKSLSEYFRKHQIKENLITPVLNEKSCRLKPRHFLNSQQIFQEFLKQVETEHQIQSHQISSYSKAEFQTAIEEEVARYREEKFQDKRRKILNFINFPFFLKSILFLLPAFVMVLFILALGLGSRPALKLFSPFFALNPDSNVGMPLNLIAFDRLGQLYFEQVFSINLILFLSFLPAMIYRFFQIRPRIDPAVRNAVIILGSLAFVSFIASAYIQETWWPVVPWILAGVAGLIAVIGLIVWIYQLLGWLAILLIFMPVLTLLLNRFGMIGNFEAVIYIFALIFILLFIFALRRIRYFFKAERRFHWPPFLMSLILFTLLGSFFVEGFHFKWPSFNRQEISVPAVEHYGVINTPAVNIRSAPTPRADVVAKAYQGEQAIILGQQAGWFHIKINERQGFIYQEFINVVR